MMIMIMIMIVILLCVLIITIQSSLMNFGLYIHLNLFKETAIPIKSFETCSETGILYLLMENSNKSVSLSIHFKV